MLRNKKFWILIILTIITVGILSKRDSNAKVKSKAFGAMLYVMLDHSINEIDVSELAAMKNVTILDAREANEYAISHIKNAINVGYSSFNLDSVANLNKGDRIAIYCSIGKRSENIAKKLIEAGFSDVNNLYGGIFEWKNQGLPVYKDGMKTDQIHAYDKVFGVWLTKGDKVFD